MQENCYPGLFVVFEGIDGSGKTTQALRLLRYLQPHDSVVYTKEPTYKMPIGNKIRKAVAGEREFSPFQLQRFFVKDRDEHLHRYVIPKLGLGQTVICDRYFLSSVAYGALDSDMDQLIELNASIDNFILPNITFIIDIEAKIALERTEAVHKDLDIFETAEKLNRVRENYLVLAKRFDDTHVVDGMRDEDETFNDVRRRVDELLRQRETRGIVCSHCKKNLF